MLHFVCFLSSRVNKRSSRKRWSKRHLLTCQRLMLTVLLRGRAYGREKVGRPLRRPPVRVHDAVIVARRLQVQGEDVALLQEGEDRPTVSGPGRAGKVYIAWDTGWVTSSCHCLMHRSTWNSAWPNLNVTASAFANATHQPDGPLVASFCGRDVPKAVNLVAVPLTLVLRITTSALASSWTRTEADTS